MNVRRSIEGHRAGTQLLVFGLPRSGTTWLGKIFDSHPRTLYRHEPDSVKRIEAIGIAPESASAVERARLSNYCDAIVSNRALKVVGKSPIFPKLYLNGWSLHLYRSGVFLARVASFVGLDIPVFTAPERASNNDLVVWKSIESLGRLGLILDVVPSAIALHIVRHPCGFVASVERGEKRRRFDDNSGASEDFGILEILLATQEGRASGVTIDDLRAMYPEERLAWRWAIFNDKAMRDTAQGATMTFAYETLCHRPISTTRKLLEFAGLEWEPQVEYFVNSSTRTTDPTYYSVFKDPKRAAWSWQDELPSCRIDRILKIVENTVSWISLYKNNPDLQQA